MSTTQKMSARERIESFLDDNSFVEIGGMVKARTTDFNMQGIDAPSDGVITGFGLVDGRLVYVYSQDVSVLGGTIGEMHAKKIVNLIDKAILMGAPIVGLIDSNGVRLQESSDALNALGEIYKTMSDASGVVPMVTGVFGNCGGSLAILASMSDFTYVDEDAKLFVNSPNALPGNYTEKCDTASAKYQAKNTDNVDFVGSEAEVIANLRNLVSILPVNNDDEAVDACNDDLNRLVSGIEGSIDDPVLFLAQIADNGVVCELKNEYAGNMATAFIKLNGATIGVVANRNKKYDENGEVVCNCGGKLSSKGCVKAADFINFCDAFNIPVLSITNTDGFMACECSEKKIAKASSKLAFAFAGATVPKVNLITGKALGSAYVVMNSKGLGADMVYAYPDAQIGCMDAKSASEIIAKDCDAATVEADYAKLQLNVESAAARGYVDTIIDPAETRKYLIGAFEMLSSKLDTTPSRKHGTI